MDAPRQRSEERPTTAADAPGGDAASLLESSPYAIVRLDAAWQVRYQNRAARRLAASLHPEAGDVSLRGRCVWDVWPELATPEVRSALGAVRDGRREADFRELEGPGGRRFDVHLAPDEGGVVCHVREVGAGRAAQLAEDSDRAAMFRGLAEQSLTGIYVVQDDRFVYANAKLADLFGYSVEELLALPSMLDVVAPESRLRVRENLRRRLDGEREQLSYGFRGRRRGGVLIDVEVHDAATKVNGRSAVVGTLLDVTARTRLEEQLRQAQKMDAVGRLAGGIAHDFNNLLTAIHGCSELALQDLAPNSPAYGDLEEIRRISERAAELTRRLLTLARKQVLEPRVLDLNETVLSLERMLSRFLGDDIEIVTMLASGVQRVLADPGQVEQVLLNLALNARDAMPDGGVLVITTETLQVVAGRSSGRPVVLDPGDYVLLTVSDTGTGMDAETRARAFEPFFTTKPEGKGTGLGLATVYGIVTQSGGTVWIESTPARGTSVYVCLPRAVGSGPATTVARAPVGSMPRGSETILLVEDEDSVRMLARRVLLRQGYVVLEARNGLDALEVWSRHAGAIDALVTDLVMPGLGGVALAERLRARDAALRVLFMSGFTGDDQSLASLRTSGSDFVGKPFSVDTLARRVRALLDGPPR